MTKSRDRSSGCFSSIVRLLLCKGSHQTHPADQIIKPNTIEFVHVIEDSTLVSEVKAQAPGTPGVVAKLMGLDSLPDANWYPKGRTADSLPRSRSLNFMDCMLEFDLGQGQHRRMRTSVSFREETRSVNQQNQDFFVVCLNAAANANELSSIQRKSERGLREMKKIKNEKKSEKMVNIKEAQVTKKEKNQGNKRMISKLNGEASERRQPSNKHSSGFVVSGKEVQVSSSSASPCRKQVFRNSDEKAKARNPVKPISHPKEVLVESKFIKKIKNKPTIKNCESPGRDSHYSSPVSVLWINEFHEKTAQSYDDTIAVARPRKLNSEKSSGRTKNVGILTSHITRISNTSGLEPRVLIKADCAASENLNVDYYSELARKLCKTTEADIKKLNWTAKKLSESGVFEEICADFGNTILDLLLNQVVEELTEWH